MEVVNAVIEELGVGDVPIVHTFNKMDIVADPTFERATRDRFPYSAYVSAATRDVEELTVWLARMSNAQVPLLAVEKPPAQ